MKNILLPLVFLSLAFCGSAQEEDGSLPVQEEGTGGRAFLDFVPELEVGFPFNDFQRKMDRDALVGTSFTLLYRFEKRPLDLGLRFGNMTYDKVRRDFTDFYDGRLTDLVQKTKNKIWILQAVVRFEPPVRFPDGMRPYLEGAFGAQRLFTKTFTREKGFRTSSDDEDSSINPRFDRETLNSDWGWNVGGAAGVKFILEKRTNTAIDLQICYRQGMTGDFYIRDKAVEVQPVPEDNLLLRRAAVSMFTVRLGLSMLIYN